MDDDSVSRLSGSVRLILRILVAIGAIILPAILVLGATIGVFAALIWVNTNVVEPLVGENAVVSTVFYAVSLLAWIGFAYRIATASELQSPYEHARDVFRNYP